MRAGSCLAFALGLQGCGVCVRAVGGLYLLWDGLVVPGCLLVGSLIQGLTIQGLIGSALTVQTH